MSQPIETVIMHDADADTALSLAVFITEMGGVIDTLQRTKQNGTWYLLGRLPKGMWHAPVHAHAEYEQGMLFRGY